MVPLDLFGNFIPPGVLEQFILFELLELQIIPELLFLPKDRHFRLLLLEWMVTSNLLGRFGPSGMDVPS